MLRFDYTPVCWKAEGGCNLQLFLYFSVTLLLSYFLCAGPGINTNVIPFTKKSTSKSQQSVVGFSGIDISLHNTISIIFAKGIFSNFL